MSTSAPIRIALSYAGPTPANVNDLATSIATQLNAGLSAALNKNQALRTTLDRVGGGNLTRLPAALSSVGSASQSSLFSLKGMVSALPSLASGLWLAEKAGRALQASLTLPVDFGRKILEAGEHYRRFSVSISTAVGSFQRASDITEQLRLKSRFTSFTGPQMLDASQQALFAPGLSARYATGSAADTSKQMADYARLLQRASVFAPDAPANNSGIAIREFLSGQSSSWVRRMNQSAEGVADAVGKRLSEVLANPNLGLAAIKKYVSMYSGSEVENGQLGLFSTAVAKLSDSLEQAFASIGRAGTYDAVVDRIRGVTDIMLDSFDESKNPRWKEQAHRITTSISGIIDNISNAAGRLLQRAGDTSNPLDSVAEALTRVWEAGAKASELLPLLGKALGQAGGWILDTARQLASVAQHGFAGSIRIAGFDVPVSVGDADRIQQLRDQIDSAENRPGGAPGSPFRLRQMRNLEKNKAELDRLLNGGSSVASGLSSIASGFKDFSLGDLTRPYQIQRQISENLSQSYSGFNSRLIAQGIIDPVSRASGGYDFRSGLERVLDRVDAIPAQLKELLYAKEINYPGLMWRAQDDLAKAKLARTMPAEVSLKTPPLWSRLAAPVTRNAGEVLSGAIGALRAEEWFGQQIEDKQNNLEAIRALPQRLVRELEAVSGAVASSLKDLPPNIAARLGDSLIENVDGLADQISDQLHLPADLREKLRNAVKKGPAELVSLIQANVFEARQRGIQLSLPQSLPATAQQLIDRDFSTPRAQQLDLIALREQRQKQYAAQYDELTGKLAKDPKNRELQIDQGSTAANLRANQLQLLELKHGVDDLAKSMEQFGSASRDAIDGGLTNAIAGAIEGTSSLRDAVRGLAADLVQAFSKLASSQILQGLIGSAGQAGAGPGGMGVGAVGGILGRFLNSGGTTSMASSMPVQPSVLDVRAFADGGVATRPTVALFGEKPGSEGEAFIPLGRGGKIGVELTHRGGIVGAARSQNANFVPHNGPSSAPATMTLPPPVFNVYQVNSVDEAFRRGFVNNRDLILGVLDKEISKGRIGVRRA